MIYYNIIRCNTGGWIGERWGLGSSKLTHFSRKKKLGDAENAVKNDRNMVITLNCILHTVIDL
jgi:hypothetical protein